MVRLEDCTLEVLRDLALATGRACDTQRDVVLPARPPGEKSENQL